MSRTVRLVFLSFAGLVGCYSYRPIEPAKAPPGTDVRARITGAASDRVAPLIGSFDTRILVGSVIENANGMMTLEVPTGGVSNVSQSVVRLHTRIPIAPADLVGLERRTLDIRRSVLLGGTVAAGLGLSVALALRAAADPQPGRFPTDPPPITRIPLLRLGF